MQRQKGKHSPSRSLTSTLAIVFALMSVAVLLISGGFGIYLLFQTQQEAVAGKQRVVAHQAAKAVAGFVQEKLSVMKAAVRLTRSDEERKRALQVLLGLQPAFRQLILLNIANQKVFNASRLSAAESMILTDRLVKDPIPHAEVENRYIGSVYVDPVTSEPLVIMAVPVTSLLGDWLGMLVAEVNLKFMWDLVDRLKVGETGRAYVVDREGHLIAFGDTGRVLQGEKLDFLKDVAEFMHSPGNMDEAAVSISAGINGDTVLGTYVPLGTPDWAVMTELPLKEAYRPVVTSTVLSVSLFLVVAALAGLVGLLEARRLAIPILNLTETATRIAGGELGRKAVMEGPREVVRLAGAFNHMTEQLQEMLTTEEERGRELAQEIEQRKNAETALTASESILRATLESTQDGVLVVSGNGSVSHYNSRFSEIWSIPEEVLATGEDDRLIDYVLSQLIDPEQFTAKIETLYQSSTPSEDTLYFKDGRVIERISYPLVMNERETGRVWFFRDVTERRKAVEELRQLRNYLVNVINSMPSVLVGVDAEGRVTQWNKQAELMTGLTLDKARSQPLKDVFPRLLDQMERIKKAIVNRQVIRNSKTPHQREGETRFEDVTIFPLVANGVEGAVIRVDDVTERVRLEEMMIQSEKMLSVGGLAAGMAHEINNPLAGILQNTAVLESRLCGDLPANHQAAAAAGTTMDAIRRYLELRKLPIMLGNIRSSGDRAAAIVQNMLSFARKSDRIVSSHELAPLLDQTVELAQTDYDMKKQYDFKQIKIIREYDDRVAPIPCEASKLQQVFLNILKNGAEAMAGMADRSRPSTFILRIKEDPPWVRVEIEDNGPGMDEKTRRCIFEPFFTTKALGKGTGLGLSVSYFIVAEGHGGEMSVQPADGGGTRFVIRLPKAGRAAP